MGRAHDHVQQCIDSNAFLCVICVTKNWPVRVKCQQVSTQLSMCFSPSSPLSLYPRRNRIIFILGVRSNRLKIKSDSSAAAITRKVHVGGPNATPATAVVFFAMTWSFVRSKIGRWDTRSHILGTVNKTRHSSMPAVWSGHIA